MHDFSPLRQLEKMEIYWDSRLSPYIDFISELLQRTPCHDSPHGSPPLATHPGRTGEPRATYKLLIAATASTNKNRSGMLHILGKYIEVPEKGIGGR